MRVTTGTYTRGHPPSPRNMYACPRLHQQHFSTLASHPPGGSTTSSIHSKRRKLAPLRALPHSLMHRNRHKRIPGTPKRILVPRYDQQAPFFWKEHQTAGMSLCLTPTPLSHTHTHSTAQPHCTRTARCGCNRIHLLAAWATAVGSLTLASTPPCPATSTGAASAIS